MLSSVSSGLPLTLLAPSGDAMAGGRAESAGHSNLQKEGRPQLTLPQNLQPEKHHGWEEGKLRQGQYALLQWERLVQPCGAQGPRLCKPSSSSSSPLPVCKAPGETEATSLTGTTSPV